MMFSKWHAATFPGEFPLGRGKVVNPAIEINPGTETHISRLCLRIHFHRTTRKVDRGTLKLPSSPEVPVGPGRGGGEGPNTAKRISNPKNEGLGFGDIPNSNGKWLSGEGEESSCSIFQGKTPHFFYKKLQQKFTEICFFKKKVVS